MDLDTIREVVVARDRRDLAEVGGGTAVLAGGTFLFSEPQEHLHRLVDITALDWPPLTLHEAGLEIAATCTLAEFAGSRPGRELGRSPRFPGLPATACFAAACRALVASHKIWRTATVGGNVCLALPAGAVLAVLVALDAVAVVWPRVGGERRIPLREFVTGPGRTVLAEGEVLRALVVPRRTLSARTVLRRIALAPLGRSGALVIGRLDAAGVVLTISAATVRPVVLGFDGVPAPDAVAAAVAGLDPRLWFDDPHGAPDWRAHVTGLLARQVVAELNGGAAP
ncbi:FAD binding domain-containing protein [Nocardia farcinica]|uniref:FAD binding domain-containing protein n=1 Tax=Nocardia farcinica TaxID=37329 RepID=UPI001895BEC6|nr:FAD binding domain-containing protein [Nocardia farcinica]MBF6264591.1 FAD binding domain-containing protein [Nocardia farcinica]MBF6283376.1 FAD binding domain-containing protein [Nocardia farcinica]MBF6307158.1 FAD binding domain-containing protein [Nocardia farcinica]MBF6392288.1 FAD binding domain-containing protein [Nocardia farcinica]MBF6492705.1 FAD binding domain-containing protein [Nocardia farcinica]